MKKPLVFVSIQLLLLSTLVNAQQLSGLVKDALSKQPVAFANIVYSQGAGTVTDIDGKYTIVSGVSISELRVSCIGYKDTTITRVLDKQIIYLEPLEYNLPTIDVTPSENPALPIMRRVIANRQAHNPDNYDPFSCIMYHKMTLDFDWPTQLNATEKREMRDSLGLENDSYLFLFESVSEKKHWKKGVGKEKIISGRVSGFKDPLLASFPAMLQPFSFYNQEVKLLGISYLNPASKPGLSSYVFILEETLVNAIGDTVFYISYRPKVDRNFRGLTGTFHIDAKTSAIKTVSARTTGTENGMRLFIRQNYQPLANGLWFPKQLESSLEFGKIGAARRLPFPIVGTGKSYVTAINTQPEFDEKEFDNVIIEGMDSHSDSPDISAFRYQPLSKRDSLTYHYLDSIGRRNHLDAILKTQTSLIKGFVPIGKLQLDLSKLIDYNDFEGLKLGLGLYTSPSLSENFTTGGYYVYGFGDKESKYGATLAINPLKNKENKWYIKYKDDVNATGSYEFLDGVKANSSERFSRFLTETMDVNQGWESGLEFRWAQSFKTRVYYSSGDMTPQSNYIYVNDDVLPSAYSYMEAGVKLKWANKETFTQSPFGKISNGTKWPVVWVNAATGINEMSDVTSEYQRLEGRIHKQFNYSNSTYTTIRVEGGMLEGDYNSTMLYSAMGSYKSFTIFVPYTFGTMRLNEFGTDQFAALYLTHGIPLALNTDNRIKPELVLLTNIALGQAPEGINAFDKGFYESGLYIKNLFSSLLIRYGFSVHYRYGPYHLDKEIDNWAFKLGLEFAF